MKVALIAIDDMGEALLLRAQLESLGATVHLHPLGKSSDFFTAFETFGEQSDVALICCHGDERGFAFPEMAEGVDDLVLPDNRIGADLLNKYLRNLPPVVISTACDTARDAIVSAFHGAGANTYIAPSGYPDGGAVPVLLGLAFYRVIHEELPWQTAIKTANTFFTIESRFDAHIHQ